MSTLVRLLGGIAGQFTAWRQRERAFAELNALDERTLADLGLRRADIPYVVYCKAQQREAAPATARPVVGAADAGGGLRTA